MYLWLNQNIKHLASFFFFHVCQTPAVSLKGVCFVKFLITPLNFLNLFKKICCLKFRFLLLFFFNLGGFVLGFMSRCFCRNDRQRSMVALLTKQGGNY